MPHALIPHHALISPFPIQSRNCTNPPIFSPWFSHVTDFSWILHLVEFLAFLFQSYNLSSHTSARSQESASIAGASATEDLGKTAMVGGRAGGEGEDGR